MRIEMILSALLALLPACTQLHSDQGREAGEDTTATAALMEVEPIRFADVTRTGLNADDQTGLSFTWSEGDKTGVYSSGDGYALFRITDGEGTGTAHFDGGGFGLTGDSTYFAFYPYGAEWTDKTSLPLRFSGQRFLTDDDRTSPMAYDYLWSEATAREGKARFHFSHIGAFFRLRLTLPPGMAVSGIEWVPMTEELPTEGTFDLTSGTYSPTLTQVRMRLSAGESLTVPDSGILTVWTVMPPQDYSDDAFAVFVYSGYEPVLSARIEGRDFTSGKAFRHAVGPFALDETSTHGFSVSDKGQKTVPVTSGQYSGIAWISGDRYAVVDDKLKGGGITFFTIPINPTNGSVGTVSMEKASGTASSTISSKDAEGVAWDGSHLFVSFEKDQSIREYNLDGTPTGRSMSIPADMAKARLSSSGGGFESLSYNAVTGRFWTTTEMPLTKDSFIPRMHRIQCFDGDLKPAGRYLYRMDSPTRATVESGATYVFGIPAITALDDGRLIVLEREVHVPPYKSLWDLLPVMDQIFTRMKLFVVDPATDEAGILRKSLLASFSTSYANLANYEGMCLGPTLADGSRCLVLIPDSQGGMNGLTSEYVRVITFR